MSVVVCTPIGCDTPPPQHPLHTHREEGGKTGQGYCIPLSCQFRCSVFFLWQPLFCAWVIAFLFMQIWITTLQPVCFDTMICCYPPPTSSRFSSQIYCPLFCFDGINCMVGPLQKQEKGTVLAFLLPWCS